MENNFLIKVQKAFQERDLNTLKKLAVPTHREQNKKENYTSVLMLSCHNIKHLIKIPTLEADCIMLNLEDGVSAEDKPFALVLCAIFLTQNKQINKKLVVRVNALDEGGCEEIVYLNQFMPDAIRVAKIRFVSEVNKISSLIHNDIEIHLSIETKQAWRYLAELKSTKQVKAFYLGILDLFADMKIPHSSIDINNPTMMYILSHFLVTCKSIDVKPVGFVYQDFKDLDTFRKYLELEKSMGYNTKACISPAQVSLVNNIFIDNEEEIIRAKTIVNLYEMHKKRGITGFVDEKYGFIDEPIYKGALAFLG
jgi:citrate lyase subunit beta/citryl-CoA lyase